MPIFFELQIRLANCGLGLVQLIEHEVPETREQVGVDGKGAGGTIYMSLYAHALEFYLMLGLQGTALQVFLVAYLAIHQSDKWIDKERSAAGNDDE